MAIAMPPAELLFDPFEAGLRADPYAGFRRYLELGAVLPGLPPMPEYPRGWYVLGFAEAREVLASPAFIHERNRALPVPGAVLDAARGHGELWQRLGSWFLLRDPPAHAALRACAAAPFRADAVSRLRGRIEQAADRLLKPALAQGGFEAMRDYAYPLAIEVIAQVLGVAVPDQDWFKSRTRAIAAALGIRDSSAHYAEAESALRELGAWVRGNLASRPPARHASSLLGQPQETSASPSAELSEQALVDLLSFLLFAGQETVSDSIGSGVHTLASHPVELARLRNHPAAMPAAVEELLRYEPPVQYAVTRTASEDIQVGGVGIGRGDPVTVVIAAACRDPRRYSQPERFDFGRPAGETLVFGKGTHTCLGIHLARLTLNIAFARLLEQAPPAWRIDSTTVWRDNLSLRGPAELRIEFA